MTESSKKKKELDVRKMYAHIYFEVPQNQLGIAVYAHGKIPGFSGVLDEDVQEITKSKAAYNLFINTLGPDNITKEELRDGRVFQYNQLEEKLKTLDLLGKLIAKDKSAQVTIDLDDPMFWYNVRTKDLPKQKKYMLEQLEDSEKLELGKKFREDSMLGKLLNAKDEEGLKSALQNTYNELARYIHPMHGPKDFPGTKKYPAPTPPTFLISKEYDFAYYPGYRGAHYMAKIPKKQEYVYPHGKGVSSEKKWATILVENTTQILGYPLSQVEVMELDRISEVLARVFYYGTGKLGTDPKIMDFNKLVGPVRNKAVSMLVELKHSQAKTAGLPGTWIDLGTGQTFKSEEQLLAARKDDDSRLPLAAKIKNLADKLLKSGNFQGFQKLLGINKE